MKDQLISFETAKLAKEKGFNPSVFYCYNENEEISDNDSHILINFNSFNTVKGSNTNMYSASTQSLLQGWLRGKHNIHVHICPSSTGRWLRQLHSTKGEFILIEEYFDTFEEALEDGLKESLNLIK